jgi:hypothetical protein
MTQMTQNRASYAFILAFYTLFSLSNPSFLLFFPFLKEKKKDILRHFASLRQLLRRTTGNARVADFVLPYPITGPIGPRIRATIFRDRERQHPIPLPHHYWPENRPAAGN